MFIPLRDRVRERLQTRQQQQDDFTAGSEQLFAPITKATSAATAPVLGALEKIAAQTEQTRRSLETLPTSRQQQLQEQAPEQQDDQQLEEPQPIRKRTKKS
jgi:hypothetical protein